MEVKTSSSGSLPGVAGACCVGLLGHPSSGLVFRLVRDARLALRGASLLIAFPMYFRAPLVNDPGPDSRGAAGPTAGSVALFAGSDQDSARISRISGSMDFHESKVSLGSVSGPPSPSLVCAGAGVGAGVSVILASSLDMLALGVSVDWGLGG